MDLRLIRRLKSLGIHKFKSKEFEVEFFMDLPKKEVEVPAPLFNKFKKEAVFQDEKSQEHMLEDALFRSEL